MENDKTLTVIENFLPEELYNECNRYSIHLLQNKNNTFKTNYMWDYNVRLDSNAVLVHTVTNIELINSVANIVKEKFSRDINNIMFYYWTPGSHIPWHDDAGHNGGITIYLNEFWDNNRGGIFLFDDGNNIRGIFPKKNRAIQQYGNIYHSVSPTTNQSDIRRTIQIFF
jgi:hypothetical protein